MAEKTLYVFPGAQRTATKLLQASLEANRASLQEEGVSVARRQQYYKSGLHSMLQTANSIEELTPEQRAELIEQVLGGPATDKVVINIENMLGELGPRPYRNTEKVLNNLKALFADHQIGVWFYIRRQDTFIESGYVREYQSGNAVDPVAYTQKFIDQPLDWTRPLNAISKAVGPKNIRVVAYESIDSGIGRYLASFHRIFSEQAPNLMFERLKKEKPFTNISLSAKGMDILKATFDVVADTQERRVLASLLQTGFGSDKFPRYHLPVEQMELLKSAHAPLNTRLVRQVRFAPDVKSYYLFTDAADETGGVGEGEREEPVKADAS